MPAPRSRRTSAPSTRAGVELETGAWAAGHAVVAGVDEVGRGALAGPVVAAAVVLDPGRIPDGLADSKTLSRARREKLAELIPSVALGVAIGMAEAAEIDATNVLRATLEAMRRAAGSLPSAPGLLLVDGNARIPGWTGHQQTVVRGDATCASIAAASIVAKVARDRLMTGFHETWPDYGFAEHVGYGTRTHLEALSRLGPCPIHRRSFRGVLTLDLFGEIG